jgi:hypothetical protein
MMPKVMKMRRSYWGLIAISFIAAMIGLRCGTERATDPDLPEYGLMPDSVDVEVSSAQQFTLEFATIPSEVTWYVDGVRGGSPATGMITPHGLFIAPHEVPPGGFVTITAEAVLDSSVRETAKAVIRSGYGTPFIQVSPDSLTVILGDSTFFSAVGSGCPLTDPSWSVVAVSSDSDPSGDMRSDGTYLAPAAIPGDITLMVTVETPDCPGKKGIAKAVVRKPEIFVVQFETFSDSFGSAIRRDVSCGGTDLAVDGLDQPGEWITVPYEVRAGGEYSAEIRYKSNYEDVLRIAVSEMGCPSQDPPAETGFVIELGDGLR